MRYGPKESEKAKFELVTFTSWSLVLLFGVFFPLSVVLEVESLVGIGFFLVYISLNWTDNVVVKTVIELVRLIWKSRTG